MYDLYVVGLFYLMHTTVFEILQLGKVAVTWNVIRDTNR